MTRKWPKEKKFLSFQLQIFCHPFSQHSITFYFIELKIGKGRSEKASMLRACGNIVFNLKTETRLEKTMPMKTLKNVDRNCIKGPDEMKAN